MIKALALIVVLLIPLPALAGEKVEYIVPSTDELRFGRMVWIENCEGCHGYGIADAPIPMKPRDWRHRVIKGKTLLYRNAIDGFIGEDYSVMPARGGNEELNDEQVRSAVDYMLYLANIYIKREGKL